MSCCIRAQAVAAACEAAAVCAGERLGGERAGRRGRAAERVTGWTPGGGGGAARARAAERTCLGAARGHARGRTGCVEAAAVRARRCARGCAAPRRRSRDAVCERRTVASPRVASRAYALVRFPTWSKDLAEPCPLSDGAQLVSQLDPRPGCKSPEARFRPACPIARELSAREECEAAPECEPCSLLVAVVVSCARYSYSRGASLVRCPARRLFVVPRGYARGRTWDWGSGRHLRVINPQTCY